MDASRGARPANKRPRVDTENDDSIWCQEDDFTADDFAHVDFISSQFSQCAKAPNSPETGGGIQRHHSLSSSPNENVSPTNTHLLTKSISSFVPPNRAGSAYNGNHITAAFKNRPPANCSPRKPEFKTWKSDSSFYEPKLSSASLQEVERQKQELLRLQDDKIKYEKQIQALNEALLHKDFEIQSAHSEVDSLKQQLVIKENRQHEQSQENERLKTELEFKRQELASEQWKIGQQEHNQLNGDSSNNKRLHISHSLQSQPRQKIFKSPLNVGCDNNGFPSQVTFSRRIVQKATESSSEIPGISAAVNCQNQSDSVLRLKRPLGIETGPGLVDIILQQAGTLHISSATCCSGTIVPKNIEKNDPRRGCDWLTASTKTQNSKIILSRSCSPPNTLQRMQDVPSQLSTVTGLSGLLVDDGAIEANRAADKPLGSAACNIFKICLGMRLDCAKSMLPSIDSALSSSFAACSNILDTSVTLEATMSSSGSTYSSQSPVTRHCSQTDASLLTTVQNVISTLKVLKQLVYCSPVVCHCLRNYSPEKVHSRSVNVHENGTLQPGTSFAPSVQLLDANSDQSFHPIVQKLFKLCSQPLQLEQSNMNAILLQLALEILGAVAINCPVDELPRFLPLITPQMLQNCTSSALGGSIFVELVSLLGILCTNPVIVEASCNQDDSCLWMLLSITWQAMRKELSVKVVSKLDNLMIQILSLCLTHEGIKVPFLSTDEIHCQDEVISGIILYLYSQLPLYEESIKCLSIPTLRNGISLLYQVATRDADFCHHRTQVNFEMFTFLHWLARVKTRLKIGPVADVLLEMWNIKEYRACEGEEENS